MPTPDDRPCSDPSTLDPLRRGSHAGHPIPRAALGELPSLLRAADEALRIGHLSSRTRDAYLSWVRRFLGHHGGAHPSDEACAVLARGGGEPRLVVCHLYGPGQGDRQTGRATRVQQVG